MSKIMNIVDKLFEKGEVMVKFDDSLIIPTGGIVENNSNLVEIINKLFESGTENKEVADVLSGKYRAWVQCPKCKGIFETYDERNFKCIKCDILVRNKTDMNNKIGEIVNKIFNTIKPNEQIVRLLDGEEIISADAVSKFIPNT